MIPQMEVLGAADLRAADATGLVDAA